MRTAISSLISISLMVSSSMNAGEASIQLSYNQNQEQVSYKGFDSRDTYDVAAWISPELQGKRVTSFTVDLPLSESQVKGISGWVAQSLTLAYGNNVADVVADTDFSNRKLTARFDVPVTIPESGLYVGYSFTVISLDTVGGTRPSTPIAIVENGQPESLWIHASRSVPVWESAADIFPGASAMTIGLEGDFQDYAASPKLVSGCHAERGVTSVLEFNITNHGSSPVESVEYILAVSDATLTATATFNPPIPPVWGVNHPVNADIPALWDAGTFPYTITLTKINGADNQDTIKQASAEIDVLPFIPVNRPLAEEYTGLWCSYCPAGFVAFEELAERYPDRFIGLAYHNGDDMSTIESANYPSDIKGFPSVDVNRKKVISPFELYESWEKAASTITLADISVEASWNADGKSIDASSQVKFTHDVSGERYRITYALTANKLQNMQWVQENAFAGASGPQYQGDWWNLFTQVQGKVRNLTFNFVVLSFPDIDGIPNSIPESLPLDSISDHEVSFNLSDIVNLQGRNFLCDECEFRVVAMVIDTSDGSVVNSAISNIIKYQDTENVALSTDEEVVVKEYYNLQGQPVDTGFNGVVIEVTVYADGSSHAVKIIR